MKFSTHASLAAVVVALCGLLCGLQAETAPAPVCDQNGACYYDHCVCDRCCVIQEMKSEKKVHYATKLVPYCQTKCPNPFKCRHDSCDTCPNCEDCVRYKRVLMKKEVTVKKPVWKCVPACEACKAQAAISPLPAEPAPAPAATTPPRSAFAK